MKRVSPTYVEMFGLALRGRTIRLAVLLLTFFVLFSTHALAQEATIGGTVTDASGAVVPNATITITNTDTGLGRSLPTNGDGQYVVPGLHIGHYDLHATASGFKIAEHRGIVLDVGDRTRIDFRLEVGNVQEKVAGEAAA